MDMRFYTPSAPQNCVMQPPSATDPSCPEPSRRFDPLYYNKGQSENQPWSKHQWNHIQQNSFSEPCGAPCPVSTLGDEDFSIPPNLPELKLPPLPESERGMYHSLCPPVTQARPNGLHPFHPHRMDPSRVTVSNTLSQDGGPAPSFLSAMLRNTDSAQCGAYPPVDDFRPCIQSVMVQHDQLSTINQSQLSVHLGLNGTNVPHSSPSPPGSKQESPSPLSSVQDDDPDLALQVGGAEKRPAPDVGKRAKVQKKKKKRDPNEPQKPVSAYALFFRHTQAAIKGQNPSATFGEVSKMVASTWDSLEEEQKQLYKRRTELAKTEYLKQLAAYRASLLSQSDSVSDISSPPGSLSPVFPRSGQANGRVYPEQSHPQHLRPSNPVKTLLPGANMASQTLLPGANMVSPMSLSGANMESLMPLPGANMESSMPLPGANMAASSPSPHHALQRCATLQHQQQFVPMQKPFSNHHPHPHPHPHPHHQLQLQPQSTAQAFPQTEYQGLLNRMSPGVLSLTPPTDYIQSGCRDSSSHGLEWSVDYCSNGRTLQR